MSETVSIRVPNGKKNLYAGVYRAILDSFPDEVLTRITQDPEGVVDALLPTAEPLPIPAPGSQRGDSLERLVNYFDKALDASRLALRRLSPGLEEKVTARFKAEHDPVDHQLVEYTSQIVRVVDDRVATTMERCQAREEECRALDRKVRQEYAKIQGDLDAGHKEATVIKRVAGEMAEALSKATVEFQGVCEAMTQIKQAVELLISSNVFDMQVKLNKLEDQDVPNIMATAMGLYQNLTMKGQWDLQNRLQTSATQFPEADFPLPQARDFTGKMFGTKSAKETIPGHDGAHSIAAGTGLDTEGLELFKSLVSSGVSKKTVLEVSKVIEAADLRAGNLAGLLQEVGGLVALHQDLLGRVNTLSAQKDALTVQNTETMTKVATLQALASECERTIGDANKETKMAQEAARELAERCKAAGLVMDIAVPPVVEMDGVCTVLNLNQSTIKTMAGSILTIALEVFGDQTYYLPKSASNMVPAYLHLSEIPALLAPPEAYEAQRAKIADHRARVAQYLQEAREAADKAMVDDPAPASKHSSIKFPDVLPKQQISAVKTDSHEPAPIETKPAVIATIPVPIESKPWPNEEEWMTQWKQDHNLR